MQVDRSMVGRWLYYEMKYVMRIGKNNIRNHVPFFERRDFSSDFNKYAGKKIYSLKDTNQLLYEKILLGQPFWAGRMGCKDISNLNEKIMFSVLNLLSWKELNTPACQRYKSDVVVALAVTHHLILTQKAKLTTIMELLSGFTKRFLVVEFMPLGLWSEANNDSKVPEWYTLEWFIEGVGRFFEIISVEEVGKNRVCILAEKR